MAEVIEYKGMKFRRYPNAKGRADRVYFAPGIAARQKGWKRLHEEIWMDAHGPIPEGHHIHHRDRNPLNNELTNLECLAPSPHALEHAAEFLDQRRAHIERIRPLAKEWHGTEEGLAWHSQHAYKSILAVPPAEHVCEQCGAKFETRPKSSNKFCSGNCRTKARKASGVDNEFRRCLVCDSEYVTNRYSKNRTCSRACGGVMQGRTKSSRPAAATPRSA